MNLINYFCGEKYEKVCTGLDELLAKYGYVREEKYYRAVTPNNDTIVFFCHFGITSVLLSALSNVSPYVYWQNNVILPSGVSLLISEEREKGIASFRAQYIGSLTHLDEANIEPSFHARFCECFDDDTRHL